MVEYKKDVLEAFETLGVPIDTSEPEAARQYKKLALKNHPDRNHRDPTATARFQHIGEAWSKCQKHYENPSRSEVYEPGRQGHMPDFHGRRYRQDDEVPMDEDEAAYFFQFMFEQMMRNAYSRSQGQKFKSERRGEGGAGVFTFSTGFAQSQENQKTNAARVRKEREDYLARVAEFEAEIQAEEREIARVEAEKLAARQRIASLQANAFKLARSGESVKFCKAVDAGKLDINDKENLTVRDKKNQPTNGKKAEVKISRFETMLHVAAGSCNPEAVQFLLNKGADPSLLNESRLTPFQFSVLKGNESVVKFFLSRRGKDADGCHPSKAAADGRTPLQLAVTSGVLGVVSLIAKEAPVPDVFKCYEQVVLGIEEVKASPAQSTKLRNLDAILKVLLTKNGFDPSELKISKKERESLEKATKDAQRAKEQARFEENQVRKRAAEDKRLAAEAILREQRELEEAIRRSIEEEECKKREEEAKAQAIIAAKEAAIHEAQAAKGREIARIAALAEAERKRKIAAADAVVAKRQAEKLAVRRTEQEAKDKIERERQRVESEKLAAEVAEKKAKASREAAEKKRVEQEARRVAQAEQRKKVAAEKRTKAAPPVVPVPPTPAAPVATPVQSEEATAAQVKAKALAAANEKKRLQRKAQSEGDKARFQAKRAEQIRVAQEKAAQVAAAAVAVEPPSKVNETVAVAANFVATPSTRPARPPKPVRAPRRLKVQRAPIEPTAQAPAKPTPSVAQAAPVAAPKATSVPASLPLPPPPPPPTTSRFTRSASKQPPKDNLVSTGPAYVPKQRAPPRPQQQVYQPPQQRQAYSRPISPPHTPESLQTTSMSDDLFPRENPQWHQPQYAQQYTQPQPQYQQQPQYNAPQYQAQYYTQPAQYAQPPYAQEHTQYIPEVSMFGGRGRGGRDGRDGPSAQPNTNGMTMIELQREVERLRAAMPGQA